MDCPICEGPVEVTFDTEELLSGGHGLHINVHGAAVIDSINKDCDCVWSEEVMRKFEEDAIEEEMDRGVNEDYYEEDYQ